MTNEDYYKELHATGRHYSTQSWATLVSFLIVVGWILSGINFNVLFQPDPSNLFHLFFAGVASLILLLKFLREHGWILLIQSEINKMDEDKTHLPLYSSDKLSELLMERKISLNSIPLFEEELFKFRVSRWLIWTMFLTMVVIFGMLIYILTL